MNSVKTLYLGNDSTIELAGLKNGLDDVYANTATVQVTLKDSAGVNVVGATWPLTMTYVTGSNGIYRATLDDALSLVRDARYTAIVTVDAGGGLKARWELECVCRVRR